MDNIMLENVTLAFRNFSGKKSEYNQDGRKEFSVVLDEATAQALTNQGLNVKARQPRDEDDDIFYHLPVAVRYGSPVRDPEINIITQKGRQRLDEESCAMLDFAEIVKCDIYINPSRWTMASGKTGIKAYLTTMYATINLDPLALKYADVPEAGQTPDAEPDGVHFR